MNIITAVGWKNCSLSISCLVMNSSICPKPVAAFEKTISLRFEIIFLLNFYLWFKIFSILLPHSGQSTKSHILFWYHYLPNNQKVFYFMRRTFDDRGILAGAQWSNFVKELRRENTNWYALSMPTSKKKLMKDYPTLCKGPTELNYLVLEFTGLTSHKGVSSNIGVSEFFRA